MYLLSYTTGLVVLGFFVAVFVKLFSIGRRPKGLPPGPSTIPILGNIHLVRNPPCSKLYFPRAEY